MKTRRDFNLPDSIEAKGIDREKYEKKLSYKKVQKERGWKN